MEHCVYKVSGNHCLISCGQIERVKLNRKVFYRFTSLSIINKKLINEDLRTVVYSRDSATRDSSALHITCGC